MAATAFRCDLYESNWHLDAIDEMSTPPDPSLQCDIELPTETRSAERSACSFEGGDHAAETLGLSPRVAVSLPIRHIIVVMKENRSFDHLFGGLHDGGQAGVEAVPASYSNPDAEGHTVHPFPAPTTCFDQDPDHQSEAMLEGIAQGKMDGFVRSAEDSTSTNGHFAMSQYGRADLPFYWWLASTFAISDRHFASMATGTYGNRNFILLGTNAGIVDSYLSFPDPSTPSIFRSLMNAGFTWGEYTDDNPFSGSLAWDDDDPGVHPFGDLLDALDNGTLPNVAFVDGTEGLDDDHPPGDIQVGEAWLRRLYQHAIASPQWDRTAIVWTYDEGGGFADHVPPPRACPASDGPNEPTQLGSRVPLVVISPWAKRHYVSHVVHDHMAITRLIEAIFDLPALTGRDANSDALLDMFDFSCANVWDVPTAPPSGKGGCSP